MSSQMYGICDILSVMGPNFLRPLPSVIGCCHSEFYVQRTSPILAKVRMRIECIDHKKLGMGMCHTKGLDIHS